MLFIDIRLSRRRSVSFASSSFLRREGKVSRSAGARDAVRTDCTWSRRQRVVDERQTFPSRTSKASKPPAPDALVCLFPLSLRSGKSSMRETLLQVTVFDARCPLSNVIYLHRFDGILFCSCSCLSGQRSRFPSLQASPGRASSTRDRSSKLTKVVCSDPTLPPHVEDRKEPCRRRDALEHPG